MKKFWELFEQSTITQSILTLGVTVVYGYMVINGLQTPPLLDAAFGLILGFFFGSKVGHSAGQVKAIAQMRGSSSQD